MENYGILIKKKVCKWQQQIDSAMEKIPKIKGVLRSNCCKTCRDIPRKTPMTEFTKKNSLTRQILFQNDCSNFL